VKVRIVIKAGDFETVTLKLIEVYSTQVIPLAAKRVIDQIRENTVHGLDPEGHPYKPYSKSYQKRRKKLGLPTTPRTLRNTEKMLTGLDLYGNTITVRDEDQIKAEYNHFGTKNIPATPFLDVGTKTLIEMEKDLAQMVNRINY